MVRCINLTTRMMARRAELVKQHTGRLRKLREARGMIDVLAVVQQIDQLEEETEKISAPHAFRSKGGEQWAFRVAAD